MQDLTIELAVYSENRAVIDGIRIEVFQKEQGVDRTLEFDGLDETAEHLLAYLGDRPVGTARIRYLDNNMAKIERLAVLLTARGQGIGRQLMENAIEIAAQKMVKEVVINAQEYVKSLYQKLGFVQEGSTFDEAGISHVKMRKLLG